MTASSLRSRSLLCAALAALLVTVTLARPPSDRNDLLQPESLVPNNRVWAESRSNDLLGNNTTWRGASTQTSGGHARNDALRTRTQGAHGTFAKLRSEGAQPEHWGSYAGKKYATLDGAQPESLATACQDYFLPLPTGWQLAPHDADSINVTKSHPWGTHLLVYADGGQRYTSHPDYASQAGQERFWYTSPGQPNALGESADQPGWYKVNACARRILIVSTTPPPLQTQPPWGQEAFASCVLGLTWDDLIEGLESGSGAPFKTGGLGNLGVAPRFEVWLCQEGHACAEHSAAHFCFVFDEVPFSPRPTSLPRSCAPVPCAAEDRGRRC